MKKVTSIAFALIAAFHVAFLGTLGYQQIGSSWMYFALVALFFVLLVLGYTSLFPKFTTNKLFSRYSLIPLVSCIVGAVVTYFLSINLERGAVIATGAVGTVISFSPLILKKKQFASVPAAVYCGAFVGMSSSLILDNLWIAAIGGGIAGILFVLAGNIFNGVGGKLGTMAFAGVVVASFFGNFPGLAHISDPQILVAHWHPYALSIFILMGILGAVIPYIVSTTWKQGAVRGSALPSLIIGLAVYYFVNTIEFPAFDIYAVIFIGASFVGMTGKNIMKSWIPIGVAGAVFSCIFILTNVFFAGYGGGLGTTACISTIVVLGGMQLFVKSFVKYKR